jgi:hypothetical protein
MTNSPASTTQKIKTKWTIGAISKDTKAAVKRAAEKDGLTISEWVDRTLHKAAVESLKGGTPGLALPPDLLAAIDDISRKLDHINAEIESNPDRLRALSEEFGNRFDEMRTRMNSSFERMQSSATSLFDSVVERTDAAMTQSKRLADQTLERIIETGDAAVDSVRHFRHSDTDDSAGKSKTRKEN